MAWIGWGFIDFPWVYLLCLLFYPYFTGITFLFLFFILFIWLLAVEFDGLSFHEKVVDAHSSRIGFIVDEFQVDKLDWLIANDWLVDVLFFKVQVEFQLSHQSFLFILETYLNDKRPESFQLNGVDVWEFDEFEFDIALLFGSVLSPSSVGMSFGDVYDVSFSVVKALVNNHVLQILKLYHSEL